MRVLHVIPSMEARDGGPPAALRGIARALAERGAQVTIATTAGGDQTDEPDMGPGIRLLSFSRTFPGSWKYSRGLGRWLRDGVAGFDVVHVHALFSYATIPACRSAVARDVPLIIRPLGSLDPWSLAQSAWKKRPYLSFVDRRHLEAASAIHVTSERELDGVRALGYGEKARVIPLGVARPRTETAVRESHARASSRNRLRVLFLSRLHPKKGLPLLIQAVGRIHGNANCDLRIAGSGSMAYLSELRKLCASAGILGDVAFTGHVEGLEKEAMLDWADVFVLPSQQENFSIAAVEAMGAGVPVVLSHEVGVAQDAAEAGAGVAVPLDAEALAAALIELARDPARRLRMGIAGRDLVERRFTWDATSDALMRLYEELGARRNQRRGGRSAA